MTRLLLCGLVALTACSSEPSGGAGVGERDIVERDVSALDIASDAEPSDDVPSETGVREDIRVDVIVDDGFARPDVASDATADADTQSEVVEDATRDVPDDAVDAPLDSAPDVPETDVELTPAIDESGTVACLEWEIRAEYDVFDFKGSDFLVTYSVTNRCSQSFLFVVEHMNDMFPLAIHKDGELWTYLGLCPGRGPRFEWPFRTVGEGISRGFVWRVAEHESLLTDCGVEYDAESTYELVGYGSTEVDTFSPTSTPYPLTPAFPILIRE